MVTQQSSLQRMKQVQELAEQRRRNAQEEAEVLTDLQRAQALLDLEDCQQERPGADSRSHRCNEYHYTYVCGHQDTRLVRDACCATCNEEGRFCSHKLLDIRRRVKCRRCGERIELDKKARRAARERWRRREGGEEKTGYVGLGK
jgi:hypothetical protein